MYNTLMERCLIITSHLNGKIKDLIDLQQDDFVIAADGGFKLCQKEDITPSLVVGDFDSSEGVLLMDIPKGVTVEQHPVRKDLTDCGLCLAAAEKRGFSNIIILGGFGGREDHTVANLQYLFMFARPGCSILMMDCQNMAFALIDGEVHLTERTGWTLSVFAHSPRCEGVTLQGVEYPLENATLTSNYPLGCSNAVLPGQEALVRVQSGELLVMMSRDL